MALKRATRVGQCIVLPLLCDSAYKAAQDDAAHAGVRAALTKAFPSFPSVGVADVKAADALREAEWAKANAARGSREQLFAESLNVSTLGPVPDSVTRVTIRGMSGRQFQEADESAFLACAGDLSRFGHCRMVEVLRRGLVAVDGFDLAPGPDGFPVEAFADAAGSDWIAARTEIYERVEAFSHLGESDGSSSAPRAGEPA